MIVETSGWRHLKEKNKLFLSYEYQKMYHPTPKMAQLSKIASNRKWKTLLIQLFSNKVGRIGYVSEQPKSFVYVKLLNSFTQATREPVASKSSVGESSKEVDDVGN